jgi:predicted XRE-type DNA-binding protein
MTKKNRHEGSSLASMFEKLGELQEVQEIALRKMLAAELEKAVKQRRWSIVRLAKELGTSRPQVDRLLHPSPTNSITVSTLTRAAALMGKRVELIDA